MRRITSSRELNTSAENAWRLVSQFEHWPEWGPTVRAVESEARAVGPGVTGRVQTPVGLWLPFVIDTVEPGSFWDWTVAGVSATGHFVEPLGDDQCRVEFSAPAWAFAYVPVLRLGLARLERLAE